MKVGIEQGCALTLGGQSARKIHSHRRFAHASFATEYDNLVFYVLEVFGNRGLIFSKWIAFVLFLGHCNSSIVLTVGFILYCYIIKTSVAIFCFDFFRLCQFLYDFCHFRSLEIQPRRYII